MPRRPKSSLACVAALVACLCCTDGQPTSPTAIRRNVALPTDGSFFIAAQSPASSAIPWTASGYSVPAGSHYNLRFTFSGTVEVAANPTYLALSNGSGAYYAGWSAGAFGIFNPDVQNPGNGPWLHVCVGVGNCADPYNVNGYDQATGSVTNGTDYTGIQTDVSGPAVVNYSRTELPGGMLAPDGTSVPAYLLSGGTTVNVRYFDFDVVPSTQSPQPGQAVQFTISGTNATPKPGGYVTWYWKDFTEVPECKDQLTCSYVPIDTGSMQAMLQTAEEGVYVRTHSQAVVTGMRLNCPTNDPLRVNGIPLLDTPAFRAALRRRLDESYAFNSDPNARREQAGVVLLDTASGAGGAVRFVDGVANALPSALVAWSPCDEEWTFERSGTEVLVAFYHTHPFIPDGGDLTPDRLPAACGVKAGNNLPQKPSREDWRAYDKLHVKGYIIDKLYVHTYQRDANRRPVIAHYDWNTSKCKW